MANNIVLGIGASGADLAVQKDDSSVASPVSVLNFEDTGTATLTVTDEGSGKVTVSVNAAGSTQDLWETIDADTGSTTANSPTDTLTIAGGTGISTSISGDTVTIVNDSPAVTPNILSRHNGTATQTFGTTEVTILFGTNVRDDSNYTYSAGQVTINTTGWYKITYDVTADNAAGGRTSAFYNMENNTVDIPGSTSGSYHRNSGNGEDTASATFFANLTATDVIRVRGSATSNVTTIAQGCRLTLEFIE